MKYLTDNRPPRDPLGPFLLPTEKPMDFLEHAHSRVLQTQLEEQHANFNQRPLLLRHFDALLPKHEIEEGMSDEQKAAIKQYQEQRKLALNMIAMVCLYKRLPLEALINMFRHEVSQTVASCAEALVRGNWIHWDTDREEFVTPKLPTDLEQQVFSMRYPMPMVCAPSPLIEETDSPYLTEHKSQPVLGEYNGQVTNLATLNALNQIPLRINKAVARQAPDPFKDDDKFRKDTVEVFSRIADETLYLTWQFDFRGRVYARGYHVNPQSTDWHKHVIQYGN